MHTHLGVPEGQQEAIWRPLFQKYTQSLRALRAGGFAIQPEEYWDCLRAGAEHYLKPDPQVGQGLLAPLEALHCKVFAVCGVSWLSAVRRCLPSRGCSHPMQMACCHDELCQDCDQSLELTRIDQSKMHCIKGRALLSRTDMRAGEGIAEEPAAGEVGLHQLQ